MEEILRLERVVADEDMSADLALMQTVTLAPVN